MVKISIEDIQKINNMVQELLKKGVCSTREEAVKMAEKYLDKKVVSSRTDALGPEPKASQTPQNAASQDLETLRSVIERTKEYTQKDLQKFRAALEILARDIDNIKKEIRNLKVAGENRSVANTELEGKNVKEATEEQEKLEEETPKEEKKDKNFHPKQGRLNSEDVSVEKMFYYGKK
ncbi:hypothetical protein KY331_05210 [Candidatus Woesearchaeota archaeon]|nr:hypothetical protein [Candidatus Woesearchaeota archaeon]